MRAIEASRPPDKRICYDPIARALVNPIMVFVSKLVIDSGIYDRFFAPGVGAIEFITARERYIDDFLKACLSEELDQVVILGAGFDTRAYRVAGIEQTRVFEVDHPTTQEVKLKRLKKVIDPCPITSPSSRWTSIPIRSPSAYSPAATTNKERRCSSGRV